MADPVSMMAVGSMVATGASGILGAFGQEQAGQDKAAMYRYQAGVATVNSALAKQDADYARQVGEVEEVQAGIKGAQQIGAIRAGQAAGNIDTTTGSNAQVLKSQSKTIQENEAVIRANTAKRAYGFDVKAAQDTAQAGAYDVAASTSIEAGDINAASTVIGTAGNVASKWMQYKTSFGTGTNPGVFQAPQDPM